MEISLSFDNAIVNASILKTGMNFGKNISNSWNFDCCFGMRLIFPLLIVSLLQV